MIIIRVKTPVSFCRLGVPRHASTVLHSLVVEVRVFKALLAPLKHVDCSTEAKGFLVSIFVTVRIRHRGEADGLCGIGHHRSGRNRDGSAVASS